MNATIDLGFRVALDQFNNWAYGIKADLQTLALYSAVAATINTIASSSIVAVTNMDKPLVDFYEKTLEVLQDESLIEGFIEDLGAHAPSILKSAALVCGTLTAVDAVSRIAAKYMTDKINTQPITWNQAIGLYKAELCSGMILGVATHATATFVLESK